MEPNEGTNFVSRFSDVIGRITKAHDDWQYVRVVIVTSSKKITALTDTVHFSKALSKAKLVVIGCVLQNHPARSGDEMGMPQNLERCVQIAGGECIGVFVEGWYDDSMVRQVLGIPDEVRVWTIIPVSLGKEVVDFETTQEIIYHDTWGNAL